MNVPTFTPCQTCLSTLRNKLFLLKSKQQQKPYAKLKNFIVRNLPDFYTETALIVTPMIEPNLNVEHVIPASIISKKPDQDTIYSNEEAYHDPHIMFPTLIEVNKLRSSMPYGMITNNRQFIIDKIKDNDPNYIIINKNLLIDSITYPALSEDLEKADPDLDIYVKMEKNCGCIFQPPKKYLGAIARIVFYFYLMYGYDFSVRPYPIPDPKSVAAPWFGRIIGNTCHGFNYDKWKSFFFDHVQDYYGWSQLPIAEAEHVRNKKLICKTGIPNIFVGYYEKKKYIPSTSLMVNHLFFGLHHRHTLYTAIQFCIPGIVILPIPPLKPQIETKEGCIEDIEKENSALLEQQKEQVRNLRNLQLRKFPKAESPKLVPSKVAAAPQKLAWGKVLPSQPPSSLEQDFPALSSNPQKIPASLSSNPQKIPASLSQKMMLGGIALQKYMKYKAKNEKLEKSKN